MPYRLAVALLLLSTTIAASIEAQSTPPTCTPALHTHPHPNSAQILKLQEQATADATIFPSAEPMENIGTLRYRLRDYAECAGDGGCYWTDLDAQYQRASMLLAQAAAVRKPGEKLALVLDIDETSLSSYCEMQREDFGFISKSFNDWIVSADAAVPIAGALRLTQQARQLGIALFFITGRPEPQRASTEKNLTAAGFKDWQHLSLRPTSQPNITQATTSTAEYKSLERKKIADEGYRIVLNVGDQWSDLAGAPMAEHSVKLPNPFYYLP